jgi:hypothetical protein
MPAAQVQASRGGLAATTTRLHLHRTAFGAVQVAPVSRRQLTGHTAYCVAAARVSISPPRGSCRYLELAPYGVNSMKTTIGFKLSGKSLGMSTYEIQRPRRLRAPISLRCGYRGSTVDSPFYGPLR